jgi:hypothetical protein
MSCSERSSEPYQQPVSSQSGRRHRFAPPGAPPAVAIGLEVASCVTMASTAHLLMSELGDLSLQDGREGAPQRLLRHQAGSTHRLGGLRYAVSRLTNMTMCGRPQLRDWRVPGGSAVHQRAENACMMW